MSYKKESINTFGMRTRSYIDKLNTIISDSEMNTGGNPVGSLIYGGKTTRILVHFDVENTKSMLEDGTMADRGKVSHKLHLFNTGRIDFTTLHNKWQSEIQDRTRVRATSFDLIFFRIPMDWDNGKGNDYTTTSFMIDVRKGPCHTTCIDKSRLTSKDGSNWYQARNGIDWETPGVFSNEFLEQEYQKFGAGEESVIIGRQRFDIGNEDIDLDITDYVNGVVDGKYKNHGIGIAFAPWTELSDNGYENYVGFCSHFNNTFFLPYVETTYANQIVDDRGNFHSGRKNRLYLYVEEDGNGVNLDHLPKCEVEGTEYEVRQSTKGVYYIEITIPKGAYRTNTMLYDKWYDIVCGGEDMGEVEMDFTVKDSGSVIIGNRTAEQKSYTVSCYGIDNKERVNIGDVRRVGVFVKENYTLSTSEPVKFAEYRLYVMDGTREVTVFDWEPVNSGLFTNYFIVDTRDLVPQRYYVDIRLKYGRSEIIHRKNLEFDIVGEKNNLLD